MRRGLARPRKIIGAKLLRVCAAVLSLVTGSTYDASKLQDKTCMMLFVLQVALTLLSITISTMQE